MHAPAGRPSTAQPARRLWQLSLASALVAALGLSVCASGALASGAASYVPNEIVVRYAPAARVPRRGVLARVARLPARGTSAVAARTRILRLAPGTSVAAALRRLRSRGDVEWAVPNYIAHASGTFIPNDRGRVSGPLAGWQELQWNFNGLYGVDAVQAWANLIADGHPGGQGVTVAVLDTGIAYANRGAFRRSPDFGPHQFVQGYDFISRNHLPNDRNGHGTFVAATIAEQTNNGYGLTGLAYGVRLMPVRVLDSEGEGEASTIAEGVVYAVRHGAQVINLSLEFSPGVTASDIPELISALRFAHRRGVLVVGAAGNEGHTAVAYPARAPYVVSVGATTEHGCLASYSNDGSGMTLVAPGGGADANLLSDPNCHPEQPVGRDIFQVTFTGSSPRAFGIPSGYEGTSMATPHVAATAALVIASDVLGHHPTPAQITARLVATARKLGGGGDERLYGAGLLDAAAATSPGGPGAVTP
jgi:serine protease